MDTIVFFLQEPNPCLPSIQNQTAEDFSAAVTSKLCDLKTNSNCDSQVAKDYDCNNTHIDDLDCSIQASDTVLKVYNINELEKCKPMSDAKENSDNDIIIEIMEKQEEEPKDNFEDTHYKSNNSNKKKMNKTDIG